MSNADLGGTPGADLKKPPQGAEDPAWRAWFHLQCALRATRPEHRMMELRAASYDFDRIRDEVAAYGRKP